MPKKESVDRETVKELVTKGITPVQKEDSKKPFLSCKQSDELQFELDKDVPDTGISYQGSANSSSSSSSSKELFQTNLQRYCTLNSITFPPTLHRITKHKFISATIGINNKGKS